MPTVSISGAVSGIDTASLVNQLMQVEGQTQTTLKTRQSAAQKAADAFGTMITSLNSLADKASALAKTSTWVGTTGTSSSSSVTTSATGSASGSLTFDVSALAAAHTLISANAVASTGSAVASGPLTVQDGDGATLGTIAVGSGSLSDVVTAINASDLGLRAAAVQTSPGQYRLQVSNSETGAASAFSLSGLSGFSGVNILTQGSDAQITVGSNPATRYTVNSASNTFSGLVPGLSFTVGRVETGVTVSAAVDGTAVAEKIADLVTAANGALSDLAAQSAYNSSTRTGAALYGEGSIRRLQQDVLGAVGASAAPGVQLTRDGKLTFDKSAFLTAFKADPSGTAAAYGATIGFVPESGITGTVGYASSTSGTRAGAYAVQASVAAAREQWQIEPSGSLEGQTVVVTRGSTTASYTVGVGEGLADAVAAINQRTAAAGLGVTAGISGSTIVLGAGSMGSAGAFQVTLNGTAGTRTVAGRDVAGTIDGETATGLGNLLTLNGSTSGANGLSLRVDATDADTALNGGELGTVTYRPGLAQRLSSLLDSATDTQDGVLALAKQSRLNSVASFQSQIDAWDTRLEARRESLTRQFTAMETAIATLKSQTSAIAGLLTSSSSSS
jgi:flagellar hook-associated protein 2